MVFEKFIRYAGLAVGLKPSATGCEARLRGLERIIFSKTIRSLKPAVLCRFQLLPCSPRVCYYISQDWYNLQGYAVASRWGGGEGRRSSPNRSFPAPVAGGEAGHARRRSLPASLHRVPSVTQWRIPQVLSLESSGKKLSGKTQLSRTLPFEILLDAPPRGRL